MQMLLYAGAGWCNFRLAGQGFQGMRQVALSPGISLHFLNGLMVHG